jgi:misacylated tRNA(Ala) deacylase
MGTDSDPRMHSAEHLLNATMVRLMGSPRAFSAHLDGGKGKCDYRFPRDLTDQEVREVEKAVNTAIAADYPVRESFLAREEAASRFDLSRLPESMDGQVRIISIGGYDACPCIGTHVSGTKAIGGFRIIGRDWKDGVLRLRFRLDGALSSTQPVAGD